MIAAPAERMRERAEAWRAALGAGDVVESESMVGGGSLPGEGLPTWALAVASPAAGPAGGAAAGLGSRRSSAASSTTPSCSTRAPWRSRRRRIWCRSLRAAVEAG